ncbi:hypothetical protein COJ67_03195 [Bacillus thuringiensis]|uniref:DUF262 domain-containing protein n=1 Tax=Bacillus thuringiensis TaxID=1428 RepID=UPI000BF75C5B|nr:DUF262 domain-containing protein [Bacillus thuringiensis]PFN92120.1 hypothetical protein COJ67_03195 [Bacillus thuringiensis]PGY05581.1 hypothetical protein COE41_02970 [Bacillus thuringiensis]
MKTQSMTYTFYEINHFIKNKMWILHPEYRRGEIWNYSKKAQLIDTILRRWYIPPIILIKSYKENTLEVLDGFQRLNVIMDFLSGKLRIDGSINPHSEEELDFDGLTFDELPYWKKEEIMNYNIGIMIIEGFKSDEPSELFNRLNTSSKITPAEMRDNLYGPVRKQVKELVEAFDIYGLNEKTIGFSNVKMTYDDIVIRVCIYLEEGAFNINLNSNILNERYRSDLVFSDKTYNKMLKIMRFMGRIIEKHPLQKIKLTKASLLSWLCFLASLESNIDQQQMEEVSDFVYEFEEYRILLKEQEEYNLHGTVEINLLKLFKQKSSLNASGVKSILSRDVIIWCFFYTFLNNNYNINNYMHIDNIRLIKDFIERVRPSEFYEKEDVSSAVDKFIMETNWGVIE